VRKDRGGETAERKMARCWRGEEANGVDRVTRREGKTEEPKSQRQMYDINCDRRGEEVCVCI